ncbi:MULTISPECIES: hypothetical protein [unclassified Spirosoma]|uniref:hypothetical protein n=1 Tax=unclassified Spirosoma TaxID=2621999 RepID=UPI00095DEAEE|nr:MULTISPECIES: hypothetical protein [unclassified Spirosoma]MBN8826455.1 hypothetical protein [Spirosoma sp.]OJW76452.1 MAG: hypothetical protein BGO59_23345 [Spirosoma sp. 48-14]
MKSILFSLLLLVAVTSFAQTPPKSRVYPAGKYFIIADTLGKKPTLHTDVLPVADGGKVRLYMDGSKTGVVYPLTHFLNESGLPYNLNSADSAVSGFITAIKTTPANGSVFGSVPSSVTNITSTSAVVDLTGVVEVYIENVGSTTATVTEGGLAYTLQAGGSKLFEAKRDPTSGKLIPILPLAINPNSSTVRLRRTFKQ